jgi:hypothetical protein
MILAGIVSRPAAPAAEKRKDSGPGEFAPQAACGGEVEQREAQSRFKPGGKDFFVATRGI